jgi:hypothetical protein
MWAMTGLFGGRLTREGQPGGERDDPSKLIFEASAAPTAQDDAGKTHEDVPHPTGNGIGLVAIQVGDPARALGTASAISCRSLLLHAFPSVIGRAC